MREGKTDRLRESAQQLNAVFSHKVIVIHKQIIHPQPIQLASNLSANCILNQLVRMIGLDRIDIIPPRLAVPSQNARLGFVRVRVCVMLMIVPANTSMIANVSYLPHFIIGIWINGGIEHVDFP